MIAIVFLLALAAPSAKNPETTSPTKAVAKEHFARGNHAYAKGEFTTALAEFTKAYDAMPAPEFVFNIGQCHFNLGAYDEAAFFYERYLRERASAPNAGVVRKQLAEARRLGAEKKAASDLEAEAARLAQERQLEQDSTARALAEKEQLHAARSLALAKAQAEENARIARIDEEDRDRLILWGSIGGGALLVAGATAGIAALLLQPQPNVVPPAGNLGAIDRRGGS